MFQEWTIKTCNSGFCIWNGKLLAMKNESELRKQLTAYNVAAEECDRVIQQLKEKGEALVEVRIPGQFRQGRPSD